MPRIILYGLNISTAAFHEFRGSPFFTGKNPFRQHSSAAMASTSRRPRPFRMSLSSREISARPSSRYCSSSGRDSVRMYFRVSFLSSKSGTARIFHLLRGIKVGIAILLIVYSEGVDQGSLNEASMCSWDSYRESINWAMS